MNPSHSNCGQECLKCVLDWYRLGSSDDDAEEDDEESAPDSPPRIWVVPDSLSPDVLGSQVLETEFDDGCLSMGLSPVEADRAKSTNSEPVVEMGSKSPVIEPVVEMASKSADPESPCTKYMNAFFKKRDENRKRKADLALLSPEKKIGEDKKGDLDSEGFKRFTDRWIKRH